MVWSTVDFSKLGKLNLPTFLRKPKWLAFLNSLFAPLHIIQAETLYKMQHTGKTIDLEKMLNEQYQVSGYDHQNHEDTKKIYIDDLPDVERLYVWQDLEPDSSFMEDDGDDNDDDIFLDGDSENAVAYSWIIYMPTTVSFNELTLRALVDSYRYLGKKYTVEIYIP